MAGGLNPILMLNGKVDATNGLVIVAQANSTLSGTGSSAKAPIAMLQGVTDASNRLVVKFV